MILVDSSVWIEHLRKRTGVFRIFNNLPWAPVDSQEEVLLFIERNALMGQGIGFIDVRLLASTAIADMGIIWTRDKQFQKIAIKLKLDFDRLFYCPSDYTEDTPVLPGRQYIVENIYTIMVRPLLFISKRIHYFNDVKYILFRCIQPWQAAEKPERV